MKLFSILSGLFFFISLHAGIPHLLPKPQQLQRIGQDFPMGKVQLSSSVLQSEWKDLIKELGGEPVDRSSRQIVVRLVEKIEESPVNQEESYRLIIEKNKITVEAISEQGVYWAMQTLRQLKTGQGKNIAIEGCRIVDWPAFRIRGFMHDTGRSYISMDELKKEITLLSQYKINVFHWHLTENQAWRLESRIFPMLNDSSSMIRMPGKYYTLDEAKDLVEFCKQHHVLLIPELEMPGHSETFKRVFLHDMQSKEGMKILKLLIDEFCETFDVPYLHIGTDEVKFTNPDFVPEMVAYVRGKGKKVISWNPGWNYRPGEIDMTQLWSYRGKTQPGIPAIDSRFHYANHFDTFSDIIALYNSRIVNQEQGSADYAGVIAAFWNDRLVQPERNILLENGFYPVMLTLAERAWLGGGTEYFDKNGTILPTDESPVFNDFVDFERRMLWHKQHVLFDCPFGYVKQTNVKWRITDAFPNNGDLSKVFPPENKIDTAYSYGGKKYATREAIGAGIYLRHVWGKTVPAFYSDPQPNHTAYAFTWVYSPVSQNVGLWAEFQNYGRSEADLPPPQGKWDYKGSCMWLNDKEVLPPVWKVVHRTKSNEIPLGNENMVSRPPLLVHLEKGWNKVFLKLPVGEFTTPEVRLVKWMFEVVFVTPDGSNAVEGLIYSPDVTDIGNPVMIESEKHRGLQMAEIYSDSMVLQRDRKLPVSGWANAGETVTVTIDGQKYAAVAGIDGSWSVLLSPLSAQKNYTLRIETAQRKLVYRDVLAGEVWICSGQSNMAFPLKSATTFSQDLPQAGNRSIRLFNKQPRWETNAVEWTISSLDSVNQGQYFKETHWTACTEQTASGFSAVAYYFGKMLADSLNVPIGLIANAVGGSPCESWIDRRTLENEFPEILNDWTQNEFIQPWVQERALRNIQKAENKSQQHPYSPCYLFESGISPLDHFPVRGVIWYQGESNAHNTGLHEKLFPLLVNSWRSYWKDPQMPFYYVQLSGINRPTWPQFRDSQRKLMSVIPYTGMAVSSDKGDSLDVHPRQKKEIGQRLAYWALNQTYHHSVVPSGPLFRKAVIEEKVACLSFDYAENMATSDGMPLRTFEIAGTDGLYIPAQAEINGNTIRVWSEKVLHPCVVRYGWQPFTRANLINGAGLPASTFQVKINNMNIEWISLPEFPIEKGVSAPFAGVHNNRLLVAGGCNFPDLPVVEGGKKKFYNELYVMDLDDKKVPRWMGGGYKLPYSVAYGASVSIPQGLVCIGGQNADSLLTKVTLVQWNTEMQKPVFVSWPELPDPVDNAVAVLLDEDIYLLGGNRSGQPSSSVFKINIFQPEKGWVECPSYPGAKRVQPVAFAGNKKVFLAGGFQPVIDEMPPQLSSDILSYDTEKKIWEKVSSFPVDNDRLPRCLVGGMAVGCSKYAALFFGGVNYNRFLPALQRELLLKQAANNQKVLDELRQEHVEYMTQPVEWYKFNPDLLLWNFEENNWENLGCYPQLKRAGAGVVFFNNKLFVICGELKPGIRTPEANCAIIK